MLGIASLYSLFVYCRELGKRRNNLQPGTIMSLIEARVVRHPRQKDRTFPAATHVEIGWIILFHPRKLCLRMSLNKTND